MRAIIQQLQSKHLYFLSLMKDVHFSVTRMPEEWVSAMNLYNTTQKIYYELGMLLNRLVLNSNKNLFLKS